MPPGIQKIIMGVPSDAAAGCVVHGCSDRDFTACSPVGAEQALGSDCEWEVIRAASRIQTELARRRWREMSGATCDEVIGSAPRMAKTESATSASESTATPQRLKCRVPRLGLAKALAAEWDSKEGKRFLLSADVRTIARHFGLRSHSSLYDVRLFVEAILPFRQRGQRGQQAAAWQERISRD